VCVMPVEKFRLMMFRFVTLVVVGCLLSACQLRPDSRATANITVSQNLSGLPERHNANLLSQLQFKPHKADRIISFSQSQQSLLLKITVNDPGFTPDEALLVVQPKYLRSVTHFSVNQHNQLSQATSLSRIDPLNNGPFSSQHFAFLIDREALHHTHYLVIESPVKRMVDVSMMEAAAYIRHDRQVDNFFTFVYSVIFALVLVNLIFYAFNQDRSYLLYSLYMAATLWALLWQEGKINDLPALAIPLMGPHSGLVFLALSDVLAVAFLYHFMKLDHRRSWLVKGLLACLGFRLLLITTALFQYHFTDSLNYPLISSLFNFSIVLSSLLALAIITVRVMRKAPQANYLLVAWTVLVFAVFLRIYFGLNPRVELIWMAHSYELAVMIEGLILAFAVANRTMQFRIQRDEAVHKAKTAKKSVQKHELLAQFHHDMQDVVADATLSSHELIEKTHIKFHLLLTRGFPIKSSFIVEQGDITAICSTGFKKPDVALLKLKASQLTDHIGLTQKTISTEHGKYKHMLFVPLRKHEHQGVIVILGLKKSDPLKPGLHKDILNFCDAAYAELLQAREMYKVALAANSDSMTQCHNRHSIECIINQSLGSKQLTTIAYADLDNLKQINDQYGHDVGDQCIVEFARTLADQAGNLARIGRIGGDEFIVVFTGMNLDQCEQVMEQFQQSLAQLVISSHQIVLSSSIGMAESRMHESTRSLLKKADQALYQSKHAGRNQLTIFSGRQGSVQQQA
jgi:diguanylate cyclase (GGDEF)-like protein